MRHGILYYLLIDALADLRAWLWSWYGDPTEAIEAMARAALKRLGES